MKLLFRVRVWLAGLIYPGERAINGYIGFKNGEFTVARINFDGVSLIEADEGILIIPNDGSSPFLIALEDAFDKFKVGHFERMKGYKEMQEKLRSSGRV